MSLFQGHFLKKHSPYRGGLSELTAAAEGRGRGPGPGPRPGLNRPSKTIKIDLNGVQVAPFGLKLCQNDAPDLRIIFPALLGPKTQLKKKTKMIKIPIFTVQNHQLYIQTPDKPLKRLLCYILGS